MAAQSAASPTPKKLAGQLGFAGLVAQPPAAPCRVRALMVPAQAPPPPLGARALQDSMQSRPTSSG